MSLWVVAATDNTREVITLLVAGLVFVAIGLFALTVWYWKVTKPSTVAKAATAKTATAKTATAKAKPQTRTSTKPPVRNKPRTRTRSDNNKKKSTREEIKARSRARAAERSKRPDVDPFSEQEPVSTEIDLVSAEQTMPKLPATALNGKPEDVQPKPIDIQVPVSSVAATPPDLVPSPPQNKTRVTATGASTGATTTAVRQKQVSRPQAVVDPAPDDTRLDEALTDEVWSRAMQAAFNKLET